MNNHHYLINKKMIDFMLNIKDGTYLYQINHNNDIAVLNHLHSRLTLFEEKGLVRKVRDGRIKRIYLTEKGKKIQEELFKLKEELKW